MADSRSPCPTSPPWLRPDTLSAMRAAYDGALKAGKCGAAAIAAACTVLVAKVPGLTPIQVGEALGAVVVAAGAAHSGGGAQRPTPADLTPEQRLPGLGEADDDADLVQALAYALRHDERGRPRKGGWDFAAELAAEHLAGHLRRANFVVLRRRPGAPNRAG